MPDDAASAHRRGLVYIDRLSSLHISDVTCTLIALAPPSLTIVHDQDFQARSCELGGWEWHQRVAEEVDGYTNTYTHSLGLLVFFT